jgi:hypothetical protein
MSKINSKRKGKNGELEVAHILQARGYNARRSQQFCGANGDADVVGLPGFHIEVKRVEKLNLGKAMDQAKRDASKDEVPIVFHRKNNGKWQATLMLDDFLDIVDDSYEME